MKKFGTTLIVICVYFKSFAQVGIGTNDPKGALDVFSTNNGFIVPRVANVSLQTIGNPINGMIVYDISLNCFNFYENNAWSGCKSNNAPVSQCANSSNIYSFTYNNKNYELVKENKTWEEAAACAVARGGYLSEINDISEQNAIFNELSNNATITTSNTTAPDGGNAAYVWIGGNDMLTESSWAWNGDNNSTYTLFWYGTFDGNAIGGLYNNWGKGSIGLLEPDDYLNNQDALGLALTNWPNGSSGEWNDLNKDNTLYFLIEF